MVCVETNKTHDVMSTALETDDRDYVTEDDLRVGDELVWLKNKKRITVRVAEIGRCNHKQNKPNIKNCLLHMCFIVLYNVH